MEDHLQGKHLRNQPWTNSVAMCCTDHEETFRVDGRLMGLQPRTCYQEGGDTRDLGHSDLDAQSSFGHLFCLRKSRFHCRFCCLLSESWCGCTSGFFFLKQKEA
jgi:hypothetical protein